GGAAADRRRRRGGGAGRRRRAGSERSAWGGWRRSWGAAVRRQGGLRKRRAGARSSTRAAIVSPTLERAAGIARRATARPQRARPVARHVGGTAAARGPARRSPMDCDASTGFDRWIARSVLLMSLLALGAGVLSAL